MKKFISRNWWCDLDFQISIGDNVRITKKRNLFDKGYTQRWTEEVFTISKILLTIPVTYKITDCNLEEIQGSFYKPELQKTSQDVFRIQKILKGKGDKSLVKWMGYSKSFNSWIDTKAKLKLTTEKSL